MFELILAILFTCFATIIMSYISMATPIGPWIGPTLALLALFIPRIKSEQLACAVSAGSIGGILATACGFYVPTLYFLDKNLFTTWLSQPIFFCAIISSLALVSSLIGFFVADIISDRICADEKISFPIGALIYKILSAKNSLVQTYQLYAGIITSTIWSALQYISYIPSVVYIAINDLLPAVRLNMSIVPMIIAIGFIAGRITMIPLSVGIVINNILVFPLRSYFFSYLSSVEFTLAFCSGLVISGAFISFLELYKRSKNWLGNFFTTDHHLNSYLIEKINQLDLFTYIQIFFSVVFFIIFFSYIELSFFAQLFLFVSTVISAYLTALIAAKIGLAFMGRFATFVMIPAMILFSVNNVQITCLCTCVGVAGGVASDILFSRFLAQLFGISKTKIRIYQLIGVVVGSVTIGLVFWFLMTHFGLGSDELFAYRAQARQLLIQAQQFDIIVLIIGFVIGLLLTYIKINTLLVIGGLLMPIDITLGLIFGGMLSLLSMRPNTFESFWSGIFVGNALLMILRVFL